MPLIWPCFTYLEDAPSNRFSVESLQGGARPVGRDHGNETAGVLAVRGDARREMDLDDISIIRKQCGQITLRGEGGQIVHV